MKKLRNLCLMAFTAYTLGGTNEIHGAQRFINLARYATAAAARCSQAFQTVKERKPVKWVMDHKNAIIENSIAAGAYAGLITTYAAFIEDTFPLHIYTIDFLKRLPIEYRATCIKLLIENRILEKDGWAINEIFRLLPSEQHAPFASSFLEKSFDNLDINIIKILLKKLPIEDRATWVKLFIENGRRVEERVWVIKAIFDFLPSKQQAPFASLFLEKSFDNLTIDTIIYLLKKLPIEDRATWVKLLIENWRNSFFNLIDLFETSIPQEQQGSLALLFLEKQFDALDNLSIMYLITTLSFEADKKKSYRCQEYQKKLITRDPSLSTFTPRQTLGPLLSIKFVRKQLLNEVNFLMFYEAEKERQNIINKIISFAAQEYSKGKIVLFHGQHDQWGFLEKCFKALLKIKYNKVTPKDFTWIRFTEQALLSDKETVEIRKNGITLKTYDKFHTILFTNLHLLANDTGSNSLFYTFSNSDNTLKSQFDFDNNIRDQFLELNMEQEFDQLQSSNKGIFASLYKLYKKEVIARGDIGRLIAISLPKDSASQLCYPTESSALLNPIVIDAERTTDISKIAENYDQVDFFNEHALILSDRITNPEKAASAGIVMEAFASEPTEESKKYAAEFEAEFTKIMNRVEKLHKKRMAKEGKSS